MGVHLLHKVKAKEETQGKKKATKKLRKKCG
jgi:hypothetical protein